MKILQTVKYYDPCKGGMESVVKGIVEGINRIDKSCDFTVYCNNHKKSKKNIKEIINPSIKVIREKTPLFIKSQPISFYYNELSKLIQSSDIIHEHYPFPTMEYNLIRNKNLIKNKKFIVTWHANIENSRWSWIEDFYRPLFSQILSLSDKIVITSPQLLEYSKSLKKHEKKIEIIPLSANLKDYQSGIKTIDKNSRINLLFVGKLRKYKGIQFLIDSMKMNNAALDIIGDGELEFSLKKQVTELKLTNRVFFHKSVSDEKLQNFYKNAHIFILPSINEAEAFGVVQLEAMSYGIPIINTALKSGVPFVSLDNQTGFTVKPACVEELAFAINRLINNPLLYSLFSKNCIERAKLFTVNKMAESYLSIYKNS